MNIKTDLTLTSPCPSTPLTYSVLIHLFFSEASQRNGHMTMAYTTQLFAIIQKNNNNNQTFFNKD